MNELLKKEKAHIRIPEDFDDFGDAVMSNFDHEINNEIAEKIKGKKYFSQYAGWNFCGYCWWQAGKWHCEIHVYRCYQKTISATTLQEIMDEVCDEYGSD